MRPEEGRLETAEHIIARHIQDRVNDAKIGVVRFFEDSAQLEVYSSEDLRNLDIAKLEHDANRTIRRNLVVRKYILPREQARDVVDISKVPEGIKDVRIVQIGHFDARACRDRHVSNTSEIGDVKIENVKRKGKDRYRFSLRL